MDIITSKKSWLLAPVVAILCYVIIVVLWGIFEPQAFQLWFSNDSYSPVEWMALPLFGLIVPLVWICPPNAGDVRRQAGWSALWSMLGVIAIVRETDVHKMLFERIWPEVVAGFKGTVFKMRFLTSGDVPFGPKLFVLVFFIVFFVATVVPLVRFIVPLFKGFFTFEPTAWTGATFGAVSVFVLAIDRLPANLRDMGIVNLKEPGHEAGLALCKALEEGGELVMALLALLLILQSHLIFVRGQKKD